MANLATHVRVAASIGCGLGVIGIGEFGLSVNDACVGAALITLGGVLPDIDVDHSKVSKGLFSLIALVASLALLTRFKPMPNTLGLIVMLALVWGIVRVGGWYLFTRFTVHRGIYHSLLAVSLFALITVLIAYYGARLDALSAWLSGIAIAVGVLVHLTLDELYSVDFKGSRLKQSFGTALKIYDYKQPLNSFLMFVLSATCFWLSPSPKPALRWFQGLWHTFV